MLGQARLFADGRGRVHQRVVRDVLVPIDRDGLVRGHAQLFGEALGELHLEFVALTVSEGDGVNVGRAAFGDGLKQAGGAVLPAGENNEGRFHQRLSTRSGFRSCIRRRWRANSSQRVVGLP